MGTVQQQVEEFKRDYTLIQNEVRKVIVGQQDVLDGVMAGMLGGGHCLLEGVPGLGKTKMVHALAESLDLSFSRIQFTPDLMPSDIIGTNMIVEDQQGRKHFEFQPGPVFGNILLADEINRATPKTQSALLEAMQEGHVTVAKRQHQIDRPFFVLATQNPLEMEGTYPLPEAQLDRFLFKLRVPFPTRAELHAIVTRTTHGGEATIQPVVGKARIFAMIALAAECEAAPHIVDTAIQIIEATHPEHQTAPPISKKYIRFGASPRGGQAIIRTAKVLALRAGRYAIADQDVYDVVKPALRHRIILNFEGEAENIDRDLILDEIVDVIRKKKRI
ncbi:MAG: AAA family ATPase [Myxococcales bacterium]|nr:AAA family ATPase [Myxococcales bacterium]